MQEKEIDQIIELNKLDKVNIDATITPLMTAAYHNYISAAKLLLLKENVNAKDSRGRTALMYAIKNENFELIELLINNGADVNAKDNSDDTVLMYACRKNPTLIKRLISSGADINVECLLGSLLHIAAAFSDFPDTIKLFLKLGLNVNQRNKLNQTALISAIYWNPNLEVVKLLIDNGVDINATDISQSNALHYAIRKGSFEAAMILISKNININVRDEDTLTPLMHAAKSGNVDIAEALIKNGANINLKDKHNRTALLQALFFNAFFQSDIKYMKIVSLLIYYGCDMNVMDKKNEGVISYSKCLYERNHTVKLILSLHQAEAQKFLANKISYYEENVSLNEKKLYRIGKFDQTLLIWAAMIGDLTIAKKIFCHNFPSCYIYAQDKFGFRALDYAVLLNNLEFVKALIQHNSDGIILKNKDGKTAIELAIKNNNIDIAITLINYTKKLHLPSLLSIINLILKEEYIDDRKEALITYYILKHILNKSISSKMPHNNNYNTTKFSKSKKLSCYTII